MQNRGRLRHLDHEGGASASHVVAGADAGEDAIDDAKPRSARGNERSHLRHDHDERRLPQISALATHVRPGKHDDVLRSGFAGIRRSRIQKKIVGNESIAASRLLLKFDHGMTAFNDFKISAVAIVFGFVEPRTTIIAKRGNMSQAAQHVDFGQGQGGLPDALGFGCNRGT